MTTADPTPPAVIATIRAAVDDALRTSPPAADLPVEITAAVLVGLEAEGWEIVRIPVSRRLAARSEPT